MDFHFLDSVLRDNSNLGLVDLFYHCYCGSILGWAIYRYWIDVTFCFMTAIHIPKDEGKK